MGQRYYTTNERFNSITVTIWDGAEPLVEDLPLVKAVSPRRFHKYSGSLSQDAAHVANTLQDWFDKWKARGYPYLAGGYGLGLVGDFDAPCPHDQPIGFICAFISAILA